MNDISNGGFVIGSCCASGRNWKILMFCKRTSPFNLKGKILYTNLRCRSMIFKLD